MHYGISRTTIVCDLLGNGNEKNVGIRCYINRHQSHQITFVNYHTIKLQKTEKQ